MVPLGVRMSKKLVGRRDSEDTAAARPCCRLRLGPLPVLDGAEGSMKPLSSLGSSTYLGAALRQIGAAICGYEREQALLVLLAKQPS